MKYLVRSAGIQEVEADEVVVEGGYLILKVGGKIVSSFAFGEWMYIIPKGETDAETT